MNDLLGSTRVDDLPRSTMLKTAHYGDGSTTAQGPRVNTSVNTLSPQESFVASAPPIPASDGGV
jgi:hypothetical protein